MSSVPGGKTKMKIMKKCMNFDCNKLYICILKVMSRHMERIIEMSIENCRAIKKADIELNGITVVSGINGCGKTTMSKMLYYIFKNTNDFESLAVSFFRNRVRKYASPLDQALRLLCQDSRQYKRLEYDVRQMTSWDEEMDFINQIHEVEVELTNVLTLGNTDKSSDKYIRLIKILQDVLEYNESDDLEELILLVFARIYDLHNSSEIIWNKRPYHILKNALKRYFPETDWKDIKVKEYGSYIMEDTLDTAVQPHFIQKVIYIDSPMTLKGPTLFGESYDYDLFDILQNKASSSSNIVSDFIKSDVIKGEAYYDQDIRNRSFVFKDNRGRTFDLNECATGVKSFSIIQMLLDSGFIDENCLLIIDEPEAHLHPQWIIEYARMIVLLRKNIKAKFFIASHSTDMVEAIRSLSEAEGIESDLMYYLGEEEADSGLYNFRKLGLDIEPIFASFNKSFERLDYYTSKEQ